MSKQPAERQLIGDTTSPDVSAPKTIPLQLLAHLESSRGLVHVEPAEERVKEVGRDIIKRSRRGLVGRWQPRNMMMGAVMDNKRLERPALLFVDASAATPREQVAELMVDYFPPGEKSLPWYVRAATASVRAMSGSQGLRNLVGSATLRGLNTFAGYFFGGYDQDGVTKTIEKLKGVGIDHTVDVVGEAVVSEAEAEKYVKMYVDLVSDPKLRGKLNNVSVKLTSLYSQFDPADQEGTKKVVKERLKRIVDAAKKNNVLVNIDIEQYAFKDITLDIFKEMMVEDTTLNASNFGLALQAYLKSSRKDAEELINFARAKDKTFAVRLVKGAYWEYETMNSRKCGWPIPVIETKAQTDVSYEDVAKLLIAEERIKPAFATHNPRSAAVVIAASEDFKAKTSRDREFEFQLLRGMGDEMKTALLDMGYKVREYVPYGPLLAGMSYFSRRMLEQLNARSVLRKVNYTRAEADEILADPRLSEEQPAQTRPDVPIASRGLVDLQAESAEKMLAASHAASAGGFAEVMKRRAEEVLLLANGSTAQVISCPGEKNEYVHLPRGKGIALFGEDSSLEEVTEVAVAALACGNSVTLSVPQALRQETQKLVSTMQQAGFQDKITISEENPDALVEKPDNKWVFCDGEADVGIMSKVAKKSASQRSVIKFISSVTPGLVRELGKEKVVTEDTFRAGCAPEQAVWAGVNPDYANMPAVDFSVEENRTLMQQSIDSELIRLLADQKPSPLVIGGESRMTNEIADCVNPSNHAQIIGKVCNAGEKDVDDAVSAAKGAFGDWAALGAKGRAQYLLKAADAMVKKRFELAALMTIEVSKPWREAVADVDEAIDFLRYYAKDSVRHETAENEMLGADGQGKPRRVPNGVCAVVAPWNFPNAILAGMAAGALAAGNTVVMKPAEQSVKTAHAVMDIFRQVGIPDGVVNLVPGDGETIGKHLVDHVDVDTTVFTGSDKVGLGIMQTSASINRAGMQSKKVISEMGGKNAIIVDSSANMDTAVSAVVQSAFGYCGQKCSACSRVIVLQDVKDEFLKRLKDAVESIRIGDPRDPSVTRMGALIDPAAAQKARQYKAIAASEGKTLIDRTEAPSGGNFVGPAVYYDIKPDSRIAQEEVFGPVLSVLSAHDFEEAIDIANSTGFKLTGAVISRTPGHLELARERFDVGNLYLNRGSTGALVGRQPFGGFDRSGTGPKAGGPEYIDAFTHLE